jgi:glycosyltransferase involved in cell wall biosynthesis
MNRILSQLELSGAQNSERRAGRKVCLVTGELEGPFFNGGVGTQNRAQAIVLRGLGYDVDILYTQVNRGTPFCLRGAFADHVRAYRSLGIRLLCIDNEDESSNWLARSFLALKHLLRHRYDLVFFDDMLGTAYYPLLARRTGAPELCRTRMCVTAHGAVEWTAELNQTSVDFGGITLMEMERRSIELADAVRAGSAYILRKYCSYGWAVPGNFIILPNFVSGKRAVAQPLKRVPVKEIVFFGRLETRKGLWTFCRALDRLKYVLADHQITFLGKVTPETGDILLRRCATWPFAVRLLNNFNREQALAYLKGEGRLAIMPSKEDNNPSVIMECLEEGITFLASSGSGGEELLDEASRGANLFEPSVEGLCAKLLEALADGGTTARPSFDQAQLQRTFAEWLEGLLNFGNPLLQEPAESSQSSIPILIVVVPAELRPDQVVAEFRRTFQLYSGRVQIEALVAKSAELRKHIESADDSLIVNISSLYEFESLARSLAGHASTVVGLCHISQMLPPVWTERARDCFAKDENISALTGMVATERDPDNRIREPFISAVNRVREFDRYLTGYAPPLFALAQDTNSGFALMRSELLAEISGLTPVDIQYDRPKSMEYWIHEILVTLHARGKQFELIPDQFIEQPVQEVPFESPRSGDFMRSLASTLYGYAPGTDQSLITRLAIDAGLERERNRRNAAYLKSMAAKFGSEIVPVGARVGSEIVPVSARESREQNYPQLAKIAHASGQIDLAVDLIAALVLPEKGSAGSKVTEYVKSSSKAVRLAELVGANQYVGVNLNHPWSFKLIKKGKEFELHPNSAGEGRAALSFSSVDLSQAASFTCALSLLSQDARPVRVRIDLIPPDRTNHCSAEKILQAGEASGWEFEIPAAVRTTCTVLLGVELADQRDSAHHTLVLISDASFA